MKNYWLNKNKSDIEIKKASGRDKYYITRNISGYHYYLHENGVWLTSVYNGELTGLYDTMEEAEAVLKDCNLAVPKTHFLIIL